MSNHLINISTNSNSNYELHHVCGGISFSRRSDRAMDIPNINHQIFSHLQHSILKGFTVKQNGWVHFNNIYLIKVFVMNFKWWFYVKIDIFFTEYRDTQE